VDVPLRAGYLVEDRISWAVGELGDFRPDPEEITGFSLGAGISYRGPSYAVCFDLAWVRFEAEDRVRFEFSDPDDPFQVPGMPMETLRADVGFSGDRVITSLVVRF
jgi:hypothetical protein